MTTNQETFRAYTQTQGQTYATGRPGYSPELFKFIIAHHTATGGQLDTVVDGMIGSARTSAESANLPIRFDVSAAEALGSDLKPPIADGSVDLLTAATAAHWFDMACFWPIAACVLKPGGTAALWARTAMAVDPIRTPNGVAIKAVVEEIFATELRPFSKLGSTLTHDLYVDLPLPWTLEAPVEGFDKGSFFRKEWNKHRDGEEDDQVGTGKIVTTEEYESLTGTSSTVTRWREAHPGKAETEEDIARKMRRRIESLLHEVGVKPGEEVLTGQVAIVLLMVKKV
ncbi:hypothetical protein EDB81DRAFT_839494 [Dactylonectria macrodidyma]|uniref:Methyltransferase type 11 domain-containing protein n=1 Tax=Dactylonectria macrodidyma TaxID=307937 RepID=A0A9P9FGI5_9HYPO|nr:hypothetical protein EDB81DRAFT_839494 [Dactylonectria macrodidyma]